jgi:HAD superfamily hydrolase (TIGR01509 family)
MTQRCVLFDMDGTLYDSGIDFLAIRDRLGLPQDGRPILEQLREATPEARARGIELLHAAEAEGAANGQLIPGTTELLLWLRESGISCGLVTNNSRRSVDVILVAHPLLRLELIVTRDDAPAKPEPDLFLLAMNKLGCEASKAAAVGDTHLDGIAAHRAGIREIHLVSLPEWMANVIPTDVEYKPASSLDDVRIGLETWLQHDAGKA